MNFALVSCCIPGFFCGDFGQKSGSHPFSTGKMDENGAMERSPILDPSTSLSWKILENRLCEMSCTCSMAIMMIV